MRLNQPKAKIPLKSDSNRILIEFFDPISAVRFNRRDEFDLNSDTDFESKFELYRKLVEFNRKWLKTTGFRHFRYKSSFSI